MSPLRALRIPVDGEPALVTVQRDFRDLAQSIDAQYVERVRTPLEDVVLAVDEEGLVKDRPGNRVSFHLYPGIIAGDVLVLGEEESWEGRDFTDLSDEQLEDVCRLLGLDAELLREAGLPLRARHLRAWERVQHHHPAAIVSTSKRLGREVVTLDPEIAAPLTDLERLVLAAGGPPPFGGRVEGNEVHVHTD